MKKNTILFIGLVVLIGISIGLLSVIFATKTHIHTSINPTSSSTVVALNGPNTVTISMSPVAQINPLIYGVNYEWNLVPASQFSGWIASMQTMGYTLMRYPSGWNAEHYVWGENQEVEWKSSDGNGYDPATQMPGASPATVLADVPSTDFIVPSALYDKNPTSANLQTILTTSTQLVSEYGTKVPIWEIGNEWWNQGGHGALLPNYAKLVAHVAPAMKAANPNIQLYATLDYQTGSGAPYTSLADEVTQFRAEVIAEGGESAWNAIDGIAIHGYCYDPSSNMATILRSYCSSFPSIASTIRTAAQRPSLLLFNSEWDAGPQQTMPYIENAYGTLFAFQDMAFASMTAATYWPGSDFVAQNSLVGSYKNNFPLTPTGTIFSWLSKYYEGSALKTSGFPAVAAESTNGTVTVFVPTQNTNGPATIEISLAGTGLTTVQSAQVLSTGDPSGSGPEASTPEVSNLPVSIVQGTNGPYAEFTLNPGTPGRGSSWEIARVTFAL